MTKATYRRKGLLWLWFQKVRVPEWKYGGRIRKQRAHILNCKHETERANLEW